MKEPKIIKNYPLLEKRLGIDERYVIVDLEFEDESRMMKRVCNDPESDIIKELGKILMPRSEYENEVKRTTKDYWVFKFSMASVDDEFNISNDRSKTKKGSITVSDVYDEFLKYFQHDKR